MFTVTKNDFTYDNDIKEQHTPLTPQYIISGCWVGPTASTNPVEKNLLFLLEIKLLKPTGHVLHQQFNIQQLYALPTLYLCVLYLSENKQRLVPLTA